MSRSPDRLGSDDPQVDMILQIIRCLQEALPVTAESRVPVNDIVSIGPRNVIAMESGKMAETMAAGLIQAGFINHVTRTTEGDDTVLKATLIFLNENQLTFLNSALQSILARSSGDTMH